MNHHYSSGKCRLLKRIFSICIALLMVCSVSVPVFAASVGNDTDDMDGNMVQQPARQLPTIFMRKESCTTVRLSKTGRRCQNLPLRKRTAVFLMVGTTLRRTAKNSRTSPRKG